VAAPPVAVGHNDRRPFSATGTIHRRSECVAGGRDIGAVDAGARNAEPRTALRKITRAGIISRDRDPVLIVLAQEHER
jgi:hypothetical protein